MLTLVFAHTDGKPGLSLGPYRGFRVEGQNLLERAGDAALARHRNHQWEHEGKTYFRLDVEGPVRLRLENEGVKSRWFGPFQHYSMADGMAYTDRLFFASLAETTGLWYCIELAEDWPVIEVMPA